MKKISNLILLLAVCLLAACMHKRSEPFKQRPFQAKNEHITNGEKIYMAKCQKCHPGGEAGLGIAINPTPAPKFLKKFQVRHGLGVMPAFKETELSRQDLQDVADYMSAWKHY